MSHLSPDQIWHLLTKVADPEIPMVSIVDLGIVRQVGLQGNKIILILTPTFSACPALHWIEAQVIDLLRQSGAAEVEVRWSLTPPWSSDWLTPQARQALTRVGIAPPPRHDGRLEVALEQPVSCPYCSSTNTQMKNDFGPTLCRAIYYCHDCHQPFERFKPI